MTPGHIAAPFHGVVTMLVREGDEVAAGDAVATIEAMKMEAAITTPVGGIVERLVPAVAVDGGDLLLVVHPA
jgi:pyruvate carboxylase